MSSAWRDIINNAMHLTLHGYDEDSKAYLCLSKCYLLQLKYLLRQKRVNMTKREGKRTRYTVVSLVIDI